MTDSASAWRPAAAHASSFPAGACGGLLAFEGSLTARLDALCGGRFALELVAQRRLAAGDTGALIADEPAPWLPALCREVLMFAAGEPVVFARTLVPDATARAEGWLTDLGGSSLGHALFVRDDVTRSAFEFACFAPGTAVHRRVAALVPELAAADGPRLWARRSRFAVAGAPLLVMEVFLPGAWQLAGAGAPGAEAAR